MHRAKSEEAVSEKQWETKPLQISGPSKNKEELLFILKWHWRINETEAKKPVSKQASGLQPHHP